MVKPDWIGYALGAGALAAGLLAVTSRRILRAAIYLLFSLLALAGLYFWMQLEFMAAVQIIIYVGGIVVLILFSIFLTHQTDELLPLAGTVQRFGAALVVLSGGIGIFWLLRAVPPSRPDAAAPSVHEIGKALLSIEDTGMALPFEAITLLLLAAMVGCIVLALKDRTTPS
ncbi:MAG: NADH-quinone oxidoreductase subunit J [Chitinophagales bacterium]|nr:NADH-quinone oxidoreductase subunit J [Chitinophagales bacterium]MDW8427635.1 NADH-quinone oxidoreductase subunit J [Chitinophagales bacterium]